MDIIYDQIERIEEVLDQGKNVIFSDKISIHRNDIEDILIDMRSSIPAEIEQAKAITRDHDNIIRMAEARAQEIISNAEIEANKMVQEHEIYQRVLAECEAKKKEVNKLVNEWETETLVYVDKMLEQAEQTVITANDSINEQYENASKRFDNILKVINDNRENLRK